MRIRALAGAVAQWAAPDSDAALNARLMAVRQELARGQAESRKQLHALVQAGRMVPGMAYVKMEEVTQARSPRAPPRSVFQPSSSCGQFVAQRALKQ
jgi:hypothetical protein